MCGFSCVIYNMLRTASIFLGLLQFLNILTENFVKMTHLIRNVYFLVNICIQSFSKIHIQVLNIFYLSKLELKK